MKKRSLLRASVLLAFLASPVVTFAQPAGAPASANQPGPAAQAPVNVEIAPVTATAESTTALPPDPRRCELHVWGAERFQSFQMGLLGGMGLIGGLIDGAIHENANRLARARLGEALDTRGQAAALASLDLASVLEMPGYQIITHAEPMDPAVANRNQNRHADSPSRCYAELMVTRVLYQKTPLYGRALRASFLFRDFEADRNPHFTYAGRGGNGLRIFPAQEEAQIDAANEEIVSVFKANFQEYANNLNGRRQRQRPARRS